MDEECSVLDSFILWAHHDGNRARTRMTARERFETDYFLGSPRLSLAMPLRPVFTVHAVFKVNCHHLIGTPLIVAFGTTENNSPWCDVLSKQDVWGKRITVDSVGSDSSNENGRGKKSDNHVNRSNLTERRTTPKIFDAIKQLFEEPLSDTFRTSTPSNGLEIPHIIPRPIELFKTTSDRVIKRLPGITITVAARRAYDVREHYSMM